MYYDTLNNHTPRVTQHLMVHKPRKRAKLTIPFSSQEVGSGDGTIDNGRMADVWESREYHGKS